MGHHAWLMFCVFSRDRFHHVGQADLTSGESPTSASQSIGITGVSHLTWPFFFLIIKRSIISEEPTMWQTPKPKDQRTGEQNKRVGDKSERGLCEHQKHAHTLFPVEWLMGGPGSFKELGAERSPAACSYVSNTKASV